MPSMQSPTERLIQRGRLAQKAFESREQMARYRAAADALAEAIWLAESGDATKLRALLESTYPLDLNPTQAVEQPKPMPVTDRVIPAGVDVQQANQIDLPAESAPWSDMLDGSKKRTAVKTASPKRPESNKPSKPTVVRVKPAKPKSTRKGVDVWLSLGVHGVLLAILGVWVVVKIQVQPVLSVVAATVESNEVLIETPMESISELESTSMQAADIQIPDTSQIEIQVDAQAISAERVDLGIEGVVQASSISQQVSSAAAPGNKLAEGAEFFGSKATGNRFVYIVDASPSMRRDRAFDAAKEEILRSLRSMKPKQRFAILFFGGKVELLELAPGQRIDQPVSATEENIQKAVQWLKKTTIQADGKPPIEAVKSALELQPDGIFLLFDGDTKLDNWTQVVRKLNTSQGLLSDGSTQVPIHVIHFFREEFQRSMQQLAQENGGSYRFVPRPQTRSLP